MRPCVGPAIFKSSQLLVSPTPPPPDPPPQGKDAASSQPGLCRDPLKAHVGALIPGAFRSVEGAHPQGRKAAGILGQPPLRSKSVGSGIAATFSWPGLP